MENRNMKKTKKVWKVKKCFENEALKLVLTKAARHYIF